MKQILLIVFLLMRGVSFSQTITIEDTVKFIALGDSYTIGQSVSAADRWPVQLIDTLRARGLYCDNPYIIATTGWTTRDLTSAITNAHPDNNYTLVSLLIGVNNYYQGGTVSDYAPQFEALLQKSIQLAGGVKSRVFVVSIPDYGYTPFGSANQPVITNGINEFNNANREITSQYGVAYINITDISRQGLSEPDLVASDGLHPSGKQYKEWVDAILVNSKLNKNDMSDSVTGIAPEKTDIQIYPNPFFDYLNIGQLPLTESSVYLRMINLMGQTLLQTNVNDQELTTLVNTSALPSGFYVYQLSNARGILKQGKIIKKQD